MTPGGTLKQEVVATRSGRALHVRLADVIQEPLPARWIELIEHLNEQERVRERADDTRKSSADD